MLWVQLLALPLAMATSLSTIYWPVTSPSKEYPWVIGDTNILSWTAAGGTGVQSFDVQLHNSNRSIMVGFLPIALRVPMERLKTGRKNYGGEIEVTLADSVPTGDGFSLLFMNTFHGQVYAKSETFSIYASNPSNYTSIDLPTATVTATLDHTPNPTQQWAVTLNGVDPDATSTAAAQAGNAGNGT